MTGRTILVSLILVLATAAITARAADRYSPTAEERAGAVAAGSLSGDVRPHWTERYQTFFAGILAVLAASIGAFVLWRTTERRIKADHAPDRDRIETELASERERREREATAVAHALAAEFANCATRCSATLDGPWELAPYAKAAADAVSMSLRPPTETVFGGVRGEIGLLGPDLAEEVARAWYVWDRVPKAFFFGISDLEPSKPVPPELTATIANTIERLRWRADRLTRALQAFADDQAVATALAEVDPYQQEDDMELVQIDGRS